MRSICVIAQIFFCGDTVKKKKNQNPSVQKENTFKNNVVVRNCTTRSQELEKNK